MLSRIVLMLPVDPHNIYPFKTAETFYSATELHTLFSTSTVKRLNRCCV